MQCVDFWWGTAAGWGPGFTGKGRAWNWDFSDMCLANVSESTMKSYDIHDFSPRTGPFTQFHWWFHLRFLPESCVLGRWYNRNNALQAIENHPQIQVYLQQTIISFPQYQWCLSESISLTSCTTLHCLAIVRVDLLLLPFWICEWHKHPKHKTRSGFTIPKNLILETNFPSNMVIACFSGASHKKIIAPQFDTVTDPAAHPAIAGTLWSRNESSQDRDEAIRPPAGPLTSFLAGWSWLPWDAMGTKWEKS